MHSTISERDKGRAQEQNDRDLAFLNLHQSAKHVEELLGNKEWEATEVRFSRMRDNA